MSGENPRLIDDDSIVTGSSPRERGKLVPKVAVAALSGLIPA